MNRAQPILCVSLLLLLSACASTDPVILQDAMGRMALNILITFAQFERELIGERIRDKVAASRKKGIWMGGWTPLGYEVRDRKLIIHEADAERILRRFEQVEDMGELASLLGRTPLGAAAE